MGLLEEGIEIYNALFKSAIIFSFFFFLASQIFNFVELPEIPYQISWDVVNLDQAISSLKNAKGLDIAVAIPSLLINVFALLIIAFINLSLIHI